MLPEYIFWFLFEVAITNSFILCKEFSTLNVKAFRVELVKQLIGNYNSRKRPGDLASLLLSASAKSISPHMAVTRAIAVITVLEYKKERKVKVWFCKDCKLYLWYWTGLLFLYHTNYLPACED